MRKASTVVLAAPALASTMAIRAGLICIASCSAVGVMALGTKCATVLVVVMVGIFLPNKKGSRRSLMLRF